MFCKLGLTILWVVLLLVGWDFLFEVFVHWIFNELFGFVVVELGFC